jgi:hypothetical protein
MYSGETDGICFKTDLDKILDKDFNLLGPRDASRKTFKLEFAGVLMLWKGE